MMFSHGKVMENESSWAVATLSDVRETKINLHKVSILLFIVVTYYCITHFRIRAHTPDTIRYHS